ILHTVFSPLTIASKPAGDRLLEDLASAPDAVRAALEVITGTTARYAAAALAAGADGLFFATQAANAEAVSEAVSTTWDLPYARRVLERVRGVWALTLLHLHGTDICWDAWTALPVHAANWHDRLTAPTLAGASRRFAGGLAAGLGESTTLPHGPADAVAAEARDAIRQTGGRGLILTPGCVLPLAVPDANLAAAVGAVRAPGVASSRLSMPRLRVHWAARHDLELAASRGPPVLHARCHLRPAGRAAPGRARQRSGAVRRGHRAAWRQPCVARGRRLLVA